MYTQEQFQTMANIIKGHILACDDDETSIQAIREMAEGLADVYAKDSQEFNRLWFIRECGLGTK